MSAAASAVPSVTDLYAVDASLNSAPSPELYRSLLSAASPSAQVAARQLGATLLRRHARAHPSLAAETEEAVLALCGDSELNVRLTAIGALPALCASSALVGHAAIDRTLLSVLTQTEGMLAAKSSLQSRSVQACLTELIEQDAIAFLAASLRLPSTAQPSDDDGMNLRDGDDQVEASRAGEEGVAGGRGER
ncbi:MAG: hypothetical protein SGPRY_013351, partial [Prymnesium sp.]